jgi:hypothetical protein
VSARPTWDDARAADLAAQERKSRERGARAIERMHLRHGKLAGQQCRDCVFLITKVGDFQGTFRKCAQYGITGSNSSDWALRWEACGKFVGPHRLHPAQEGSAPCPTCGDEGKTTMPGLPKGQRLTIWIENQPARLCLCCGARWLISPTV